MINIKKVLNFLESKFEEIFACVALVIISLCVISQVISRYVFNFGITWTEELAGFAMPWAIYMGAALGVRERFHIIQPNVIFKFCITFLSPSVNLFSDQKC